MLFLKSPYYDTKKLKKNQKYVNFWSNPHKNDDQKTPALIF